MHLLWGASGFPDSRSSHSRTRKQDHCSESSERSVRVQNRNPWEIRRLKTAAAHQRRWINGTQVTNVAAACYTAGPGCHSESNERSLRNSLWMQALVGDYSQRPVTGAAACYCSVLNLSPARPLLLPVPWGKALRLSSPCECLILFLSFKRLSVTPYEVVKAYCFFLGENY